MRISKGMPTHQFHNEKCSIWGKCSEREIRKEEEYPLSVCQQWTSLHNISKIKHNFFQSGWDY